MTQSNAKIGAAVGASKQSVHQWRRGEKLPAAPARTKLHAAYGIDPATWEQAPATAKPASSQPAPPRSPGARTTALEEADLALRDAREQADQPGLSIAVRARLKSIEFDAIALKSRLEREQALLDDRLVREHPAWIRIRALLVRFAEKLPAAETRELIAEIRKAEGSA